MSNKKVQEVYDAIESLNRAKEDLRKLDVLRSERLTGEFGEWFAEVFFDAPRADSTSQSGWDLVSRNGDKIQVKTHAKGDNNNARWTEWKYQSKEFDILVILIFTKELKLKEAYRIPYNVAMRHIDFENKQVVLKWDYYPSFSIIEEIKKSALSMFCKDS